MPSVLVIGIGNPLRGDDSIGLEIARRLALRKCPCCHLAVVEEPGETTGLMEAWQGRQSVVLIDAVATGAKPGTVVRVDLGKEKFPQGFSQSTTHSFGLALSVELARALGDLPEWIVFFGVEGADYTIGGKLSEDLKPIVDTAAEHVYKAITEQIKGVSHA